MRAAGPWVVIDGSGVFINGARRLGQAWQGRGVGEGGRWPPPRELRVATALRPSLPELERGYRRAFIGMLFRRFATFPGRGPPPSPTRRPVQLQLTPNVWRKTTP